MTRTNSYKTCSACIEELKFNENDIKKLKHRACWSSISINGNFLIQVYEDGIFNKYLPDLVNIVNEITPCKLYKYNGNTYFTFRSLELYSKSLLLLNLLRLAWYDPIISNTEDYLKEITERFNKKDYKDIIELITSIISKHINSKIADKNNYFAGDHCFFYKNVNTQTLKRFEMYSMYKKSGQFRSMSSFLQS